MAIQSQGLLIFSVKDSEPPHPTSNTAAIKISSCFILINGYLKTNLTSLRPMKPPSPAPITLHIITMLGLMSWLYCIIIAFANEVPIMMPKNKRTALANDISSLLAIVTIKLDESHWSPHQQHGCDCY